MITPHQPVISPQAVCLSRVDRRNADATMMSHLWVLKTWSCSLLIACFTGLSGDAHNGINTDKFVNAA